MPPVDEFAAQRLRYRHALSQLSEHSLRDHIESVEAYFSHPGPHRDPPHSEWVMCREEISRLMGGQVSADIADIADLIWDCRDNDKGNSF